MASTLAPSAAPAGTKHENHIQQHSRTSQLSNQKNWKDLFCGKMHMCSGSFPSTAIQVGKDSVRVRRLDNETKRKEPGNIWVKSNSYESLLRRCVGMKSLMDGKIIHSHMIRTGFKPDIYLTTMLLTMYAKCGNVGYARQLFDKMSEPNLVSWTAMIAGYAQHGRSEDALSLFYHMQLAGERPNQFSFGSVLRACAKLAALEQGKQVHASIIKTFVESNVIVWNTLVDMYVKCQCLFDARRIFDEMPERSVVSWTTMIAGYAREGFGKDGLALFHEMETSGVKPNHYTFTSVLSACSSVAALDQGKQVHARILKTGVQLTVAVGNALVDMYGKCGNLMDARQIFDGLPERSLISWNTLISGYAKQGHSKEAFHMLEQMQQVYMKPDHFTFASVLSVCASLAAIGKGRQVHAHIIKRAFELNVVLGTALIDMYAKCGDIVDARQVFDKMPQLDLVSWNAMIAGYGKHGLGKEAIRLFSQMDLAGMQPNHSTFVGILVACSHAGLVNEGWHYFYSMSREHCIMPRAEHYACMVDVLGRAGCLGEAVDLINNMPVELDAVVWGALLGACSVHGNLELGRYAAEQLFELEPENGGMYVVLSNMYAAAGRWDDVAMIRKLMKDREINKEQGRSWIEVKNRVHSFVAEDRSHPQTDEIYAILERLREQMKKLGLCGDCHAAKKFVSKMAGQEAVGRDPNLLHHFKDWLGPFQAVPDIVTKYMTILEIWCIFNALFV
eukprot:Gb_35636 [translate_table: standard]